MPTLTDTFLIWCPANHLSISTISRYMRVLYSGRESICSCNTSSSLDSVIALPNQIPLSPTFTLFNSGMCEIGRASCRERV